MFFMLANQEKQRETYRKLQETYRSKEYTRKALEYQEQQLKSDIDLYAFMRNNDVKRILAWQLAYVRKRKERLYTANSKITSAGYQNKNIGTNVALRNANLRNFQRANKTMSDTMIDKTLDDMLAGSDDEEETNAVVNKVVNEIGIEIIAANVRNFQQANMKMEMTDEMINDTLDDMLAGSDDEEETNAVVNKVLDEIGIKISGQMSKIAFTATGDLEDTRTDKDIAAQLAKLRST